jgi:PHD/YefM family antitoxin component YafN of YafNO toxin-antitoxin module
MPVTMPAQEIKRRGISVLNEKLASGPVWVISNNTPKYVVMFADEFKRMRHEAFVNECLQSEAEYRAGLAKPTTVEELMKAFDE